AEIRRDANEAERKLAAHALGALAGGPMAMGKLFTELGEGSPGLQRRDFENLMTELGRQGLVEVSSESFERDGERIEYRRAGLTARGLRAGISELEQLRLPERSGGASARRKKPSALKAANAAPEAHDPQGALRSTPLFEALREWRREIAREKNLPAFRVLA